MFNNPITTRRQPKQWLGSRKIETLVFAIACFLVSDLASQSSRVGINTASPLAGLHVADSSVLFTGIYDPTFGPNAAPVSGSGTRMFWVPRKGAFRSGTVTATQWNSSFIGYHSFASGYNPTASGWASASLGYQTSATGIYSTSMGYNNISSGESAVTLGSNNTSSGTISTSFGNSNVASGDYSTAMGALNVASGAFSTATGLTTMSLGDFSFVAGLNNITNAYASFSIGQHSDTTNSASLGAWILTDPLFIVGNGTSSSARSNALTILKNGNTGLSNKKPTFRLQVTNNNANDGGFLEGILVENTNANPGEASISFRNKSIPTNKQWIIGMDQSPSLAFNYGTAFTNSSTHMVLDTTGRMGINTISPAATLHVVRSGPSGGPFNSNSLAIFESNFNSYIQLSSENTDETGILSGNQATAIRSAIVFQADSAVHIRSGGNTTRLAILKNGNVGVGVTTPTEKLQVNGTVKLGTNGTVITEIIKATVNINLPSIAAGATLAQIYSVTNAALTSAVSVSPGALLNAGIVVASTRVSAAGSVEVRFVNTTVAAIDVPAMDYHFTVIR